MFHVPHPSLGPEGFFCCVKGCTNFGTKKPAGVTFHKFPSDAARAREWLHIVRENSLHSSERDRPLSRSSIICSEHFNPRDVDRSVPSRPCIRESAVPTLFPPLPDYLAGKRTIIRTVPVPAVSEVDEEETVISSSSISSQDDSQHTPCISAVEGHVYKVGHSYHRGEDSDDSSYQYEIVTVDPLGESSPQAELEKLQKDIGYSRRRSRARPRVQTVVPPTSEILYNVLVKTERFRSALPPNWHRIVHKAGANGCVIFTCYESRKQEGSLPRCVREVLVDRACRVHCFVGGIRVDLQAHAINDDINTLEDVVLLIAAVDALRLCRGLLSADDCVNVEVAGAHLDMDLTWRADDCPQVVTSCCRCDSCSQMRKVLLQRLRKGKQEEPQAAAEDDTWPVGEYPPLYHHFLLDSGHTSQAEQL